MWQKTFIQENHLQNEHLKSEQITGHLQGTIFLIGNCCHGRVNISVGFKFIDAVINELCMYVSF